MNSGKRKILILAAGLGAAALSGCGGSSGGTSTPTPPVSVGTPASTVFVVQNITTTFGSLPQILEFPAGANGSVAPTSSLTLASGELVQGVAVDASGQIYVSGILISQAAVIQVFAAGASGTATPVRTITLPNGADPVAMTLDASGQLFVVDDSQELLVYSSTADGTAVPTRTISGALTTLGPTADIAVDSSGSIYVATVVATAGADGTSYSGKIQVFAPGATGNVGPQRVITNSNLFLGVAPDAEGNLYASLDVPTTGGTSSIVEYAASANGAATPTRTISGAATELATAGALRVDAAGKIYVPNQAISETSTTYSLYTFAPTASGNVAPVAAMTSSSWTAGAPEIAIK
jgi:sugar lactone lactonase YvrE